MARTTERLARLPERRPLLTLAAAVVVCEAGGVSGSVFTVLGLESWNPSLERPALAPPNWVFGPVSTALFALMGIAAWLVWRESSGPHGRADRLALFAGQFVLTVGWSAVFFGARSILGGGNRGQWRDADRRPQPFVVARPLPYHPVVVRPADRRGVSTVGVVAHGDAATARDDGVLDREGVE